MTQIRFRPGAIPCALVLLLSLAGCGEQRSVLAPTQTPVAPTFAVPAPDAAEGSLTAGAPALSLYNADFRHTYPQGTYTTDPQTWVRLDVGEEPVTVNWFARARGGARVRAYRWTLDIEDVLDPTPRLNETTDLAHWSQLSASTLSATVGPFAAGEQHLLYVEVTDSNGLRSLAIVQLRVGTESDRPRQR